jgi:uncharacterized protein (DUF885 family)
MHPTRSLLASAALLAAALPAAAAPTTHDLLTQLAEETVYRTAEEFPMYGTNIGLTQHDGELTTPSEAARAARLAEVTAWMQRLDVISGTAGKGATLVDRDDIRLLRAQLQSDLSELLVRQDDRRNYAGPALGLVNALFEQFLTLPVVGLEGAAPADVDRAWDNIVSRLEKGSAYIVAGQGLATHPGHLQGVVGSQGLQGVPDFLGGPLTDAAKAQLASRPDVLRRFLAARDAVLATAAATKAYIDAHLSTWPENFAMGRDAYNRMLKEEYLLPFDDIDISRMASDELAHGWAEEAWLTALSGERKTPFGPGTGGGQAPGGAALVDYYRQRIAELRKFVVDHHVVTIPAWLGKIDVVETPKFLQPVSPGASMNPPRLFAPSTTGFYFITPPKSLDDAAATLDMNEDFDRDRIWSTGAHEAMPGHFLQLSIAKRHPDFIRRIQDSPVFEEGWAFYGEEMFVRLGLYGDDLDGRLYTARWERVRGARATVDPKLASGEWSVEQAVAFFERESGFTHEASVEAVAGYALQPGYVLAYTVGRLQLETLLGEYMKHEGAKGSLLDFHDRLLSYGSTPFAVVAPELMADLDKPASAVRAAANY